MVFQKTAEKNENKEIETIIGPSVKIKGDFNCQGNMEIEGEVEGSIKTAGDILIGQNAKIKAGVSAKNGRIEGEVYGNININGYLEIGATAKILGDIRVSKISIAKGAVFNGKCDMSADNSSES